MNTSLLFCKGHDRNYVTDQATNIYIIYLWLIQWHCQFILCNTEWWDDQCI